MIIGKVIGNLHSTINHPFYDGKKMLIVEKIELDGQAAAGYLVAVDRAGAGPGETVLVLDEATGALHALASNDAPIRCAIVGIVDEINVAKTP